MKTRVFFFLAAAALLAGCAKEALTEKPEASTDKTVLTVGLPNEGKTYIDDPAEGVRKVYWTNGDQIAANGVESVALSGLTPPGETHATFTFKERLDPPYFLAYPVKIWADARHVTLPAIQSYKSGNFADGMLPMAGYSEDGSSATINHLCAILQIKIKRAISGTVDEDNIIAVRFKGKNSEKVNGTFGIDYTKDPITLATATGSTSEQEVRVVKSQATSTSTAIEYYLVVPARTYENGFDIIVQDVNGHIMTKSKASSWTGEAGKLYKMPEFEFVPTETELGVKIATAQDLIDFATAYNNKEYAELGSSLIATVTADIITFDANTSEQFNETGGIGTNDDGKGGTNYFNGIFDGNNHAISGLKATVPLFAYVGANGRIEYLTLTETCSFDYSSAIAEDKSLGSIAGYSEGDLFNCVNKADVSCSSARTAGVLNIGGVVGRQYATGTISNCVNYGSVTCTMDGSPDIYMGGIAGTVERPSSGHTALIKGCVNYGDVKNGIDSGEPAQSCFLHIGGVVGWIYSSSSSASMEISGLINTGNVTKTNNSGRDYNGNAVLVGGIVGGIHGPSISDQSGTVAIKNSHVMNCRVQTGSYNNATGYGQASHVGGFVAVARGSKSSKNISFSDDCYVKDVYVICRRGYAGGFVSWARGADFSGCHVLSSSVRGSLANCYFAGGIAGCAYDCNLSGCIVLLTKEDSAGVPSDSYTLFAQGSNNMAGGIVAQARGIVSIDGCKAYVKNIVQGESGKEAYRGWIIGYIADGDAGNGITIKDCAIGGASTSATTITLDADNFDDDHNNHTYGYFYGSNGTNGTVTFTGTQSYWEAIKTADITIASYAKGHDWEGGGTKSYSIEQGDVTLTPSDNGGENHNGVYNSQWRFYQARGGGLTISVSGGHTLVRATFTYDSTNGGVLLAPDGATRIASDGSCNLSGTSASFTLGNTGDKTNGQVRFTRIVVEYTNSPFINK